MKQFRTAIEVGGKIIRKAMLNGAKSASSTACYIFYYQPKEPQDLKSRLRNIDQH